MSGSSWLTVPADWFDIEPMAVTLRDDFVQIYRSGSSKAIIDSLMAIWSMIDRGALWIASLGRGIERASEPSDVPAAAYGAMLPTVAQQMRSLTSLARAGLDHLPIAMACGRSALEVGVRVAWVGTGKDMRERTSRTLALHAEAINWKEKVASAFDQDETTASDRWRDGVAAHTRYLTTALRQLDGDLELPKVPTVRSQLIQLGLGRLYRGYRLASSYVHSGLPSALERQLVITEDSPYGTYWPNDWFLPVSMCAWACHLVAQILEENDLGPVRGTMLAAELLILAPGPSDERGGDGRPHAARCPTNLLGRDLGSVWDRLSPL